MPDPMVFCIKGSVQTTTNLSWFEWNYVRWAGFFKNEHEILYMRTCPASNLNQVESPAEVMA
jgi:hypothetical protein